MKLSRPEFILLRDYIHSICGIAITDNKTYLVQQRLEPLALALGCRNFSEYYQKITKNPLPIFQEQIINAITTNETSFFRDTHPFVTFKEHILPRLAEVIHERKTRQNPRKGPKVRLWSAGSSTGQEPYSLAMLIQEFTEANSHFLISRGDFGILATDISSRVLAKAMAGEYKEAEIKRGLSPERVATYFKKEKKDWLINSSIRSMIEFRQINLIRPFTIVGGMDVIFCRNVLIYFDNEIKTNILKQFYNMLSSDGILILGATENVYAITDKFESVRYGDTLLYQKK
ncbi:MAG: hypothetical protein B6245_19550 [Desulfobacteraceae bacterium 4572_88]|nr:MAG: hypothetical protein B6245_19550 [Desulfobacteraceae bacterium 4572_88]